MDTHLHRRLGKHAFTLIEVIVVFLVIALLAAIAAVAYTSVTSNARLRAAQDELVQVAHGAQALALLDGRQGFTIDDFTTAVEDPASSAALGAAAPLTLAAGSPFTAVTGVTDYSTGPTVVAGLVSDDTLSIDMSVAVPGEGCAFAIGTIGGQNTTWSAKGAAVSECTAANAAAGPGGSISSQSPSPSPSQTVAPAALQRSATVLALNGTDLTANGYVTQTMATPPGDGSPTLHATFSNGGSWATLISNGTFNLSGNHLLLDVYADNAMSDGGFAPTLKLMSGATVLLEQRQPVRVGQWTTVSYDLTGIPAASLANVTQIQFYVADSVNPTSVSVWLRDFRLGYMTPAIEPAAVPIIFVAAGDSTIEAAEQSATLALTDPKTPVAMRYVGDNQSSPYLLSWQANNVPYYLTVASSDFVDVGDPVTLDPAVADSGLAHPSARGEYMHEVLSYLASQNSWNYTTALTKLPWTTLDAYASNARQHNVKLIWSEPADSWNALLSDATARTHLQAWGDVLVPMYATNFDSQGSGFDMLDARDNALDAAEWLGVPVGQSHQGWHFEDDSQTVTAANSQALAQWGRDGRVSVWQFEGKDTDLESSAPYWQGAKAFICSLPRQTPCG